jgi:hypothetical protein
MLLLGKCWKASSYSSQPSYIYFPFSQVIAAGKIILLLITFIYLGTLQEPILTLSEHILSKSFDHVLAFKAGVVCFIMLQCRFIQYLCNKWKVSNATQDSSLGAVNAIVCSLVAGGTIVSYICSAFSSS